MNRPSILEDFVARDLKYRHGKKSSVTMSIYIPRGGKVFIFEGNWRITNETIEVDQVNAPER